MFLWDSFLFIFPEHQHFLYSLQHFSLFSLSVTVRDHFPKSIVHYYNYSSFSSLFTSRLQLFSRPLSLYSLFQAFLSLLNYFSIILSHILPIILSLPTIFFSPYHRSLSSNYSLFPSSFFSSCDI